MTKNLTFIFLLLAFACDTKEQERATEQLEITYSIDTVLIDSKGYFFYLSEFLGKSFLAKDGKTLYNLNQKKPQLEVIDLATLALKDTIPLEQEGPAGIGKYDVYDDLQVLENGEIFIFAWTEIARLSSDRESVERFRFDYSNLKGDSLKSNESIRYDGLISDDGTQYFTFYGNLDELNSRLGLAIIDLEEMSLKKVDLPLFGELKQFEILTDEDSQYPYTYVEPVYLTQMEDQLLVSSSPINEVYQLDLTTGKYDHLSFSSSLNPNRVEVTYPTNSNSGDAVRERWKQVSFYKLTWDQETELFWRLTNQSEILEEGESNNKVALTFFDKDLNQVGELKLPEDWKIRGAQFISQGMYWQFINIDDEMAFIRFKPKFIDQ